MAANKLPFQSNSRRVKSCCAVFLEIFVFAVYILSPFLSLVLIFSIFRIMERLEGPRAKSGVFLDHAGYLYRCDKSKNQNQFLRCLRQTCRARSVIRAGAVVQELQPHTHLADAVQVEVLRAKALIRDRARHELTPPHRIFAECQEGLSEEALVQLGGFAQCKTFIYAARREGLPPNPHDLAHAEILIMDERYFINFKHIIWFRFAPLEQLRIILKYLNGANPKQLIGYVYTYKHA